MKKLTSIVLLLCMLIGVFSLSASATTPESIAIDTAAAEAYWTDASTGQFIVNADATVYEISTAEQLLGLSLAMENNNKDQTWTEGKTFKLTADIDLNPGVDWAAYKAAQLEGTTYEGVAPVNRWMSLDNFYGSIDGQGHTVNGLWTDNTDAKAGDVAHYAVFGGSMYPCLQEDGTYSNSVKNIVLDNGYIKNGSKNGRGVAGVAGVIRMLAQENCSYTLENIYVGKNYTVDGRTTQSSNVQIGGVAIGWYNTGNSANPMKINYTNVVFAGHVEGSTAVTKYDGVFAGIWRVNEASGKAKFNIKLTDCAFIGTGNELNMPVWGGHTPVGIDIKDYVTTDNSFTKEELQAVPAGLEGKWIETAEGVMPVVVADMLTECAYQATTATEGKYSIRLIGEIASLNYKSVDFKVKITRADGKSAYWGYDTDGYTNAETAYTSLIANNKTVTPADLNKGIIDGENSRFYVLTLNDLDVNETYTITVSTVWTLKDGTVVESASTKTLTPEPWVAE